MKTLSFLFAACVFAAPTYAQCGTPDALEDNDDCASAVALPGNSATGLNVEDVDRDFYAFTVNNNERMTIDLTHVAANGDMDLYLWDPNFACDSEIAGEGGGNGELALAFTGNNAERITYDNLTGAALNVVLEVRLWSGDIASCNEYDLSVSFGPVVPNACSTPDSLEPNFDCNTAAVVPGNSATGLNVSDTDRDFYAITVPAMQQVTVDLTFLAVGGDLDAYIFDPAVGCDTEIVGEGPGNGALAIGFNVGDNEQVVYANTSAAPQNLVLEARLYSGEASDCNTYDMAISFGSVVPNACTTPDSFEPNTNCLTAAPVGSGSYTGLNAAELDNDYYAVSVAPGATLNVQIFFTNMDGDLDLYLWDPLGACDTNQGLQGFELVSSDGTTDFEEITYVNSTAAVQDLIVEVDMFSQGGCNTYDMDIVGATSGPSPQGTPFCNPGLVNTTGMVGVAGYEGSLSVAANNATLTAKNLPANQFGIFVTSTTIVAPFAVADGQLCLSGNIGRYQQLSQIWGSGPTGNDGSLVIDLTAIPTTGPLVSAMVGETRGFQGWFRDFSPAGANFTEGIQVTFTP